MGGKEWEAASLVVGFGRGDNNENQSKHFKEFSRAPAGRT
jgi:hypothetical protein